MRVYTLTRTDLGGGYTTPNISDIVCEAEVELEENGENPETEFTKDNIPKFINVVESLEVVEPDQEGCIAVFGPFVVIAGEMSQEEYDSLGEFDGW